MCRVIPWGGPLSLVAGGDWGRWELLRMRAGLLDRWTSVGWLSRDADSDNTLFPGIGGWGMLGGGSGGGGRGGSELRGWWGGG